MSDEATFPLDVFKSCDVQKTEVASDGSEFVGSKVLNKLAKDDEKESGMIMAHEKFQIVFSSTFDFEDYKEFLDGAGAVPWDDCMVFEVEE